VVPASTPSSDPTLVDAADGTAVVVPAMSKRHDLPISRLDDFFRNTKNFIINVSHLSFVLVVMDGRDDGGDVLSAVDVMDYCMIMMTGVAEMTRRLYEII